MHFLRAHITYNFGPLVKSRDIIKDKPLNADRVVVKNTFQGYNTSHLGAEPRK